MTHAAPDPSSSAPASPTAGGATSSTLIIGIAGGSGSGKTTISRAIMGRLPPGSAAYIQHDAYYRDRADVPAEERARINYDHPDSLDNTLLVAHLDALRAGQPIERPVYDFVTHSRQAKTVRVEPCRVIVVEGILIFAAAELVERMDIKLYIDTPADIRILRRIRRDLRERGRAFEDVRRQYYETVRPMHEAFVEPSKRVADLIVPEGGDRNVAIDLIETRVRRELQQR
jgi:uridine kinase